MRGMEVYCLCLTPAGDSNVCCRRALTSYRNRGGQARFTERRNSIASFTIRMLILPSQFSFANLYVIVLIKTVKEWFELLPVSRWSWDQIRACTSQFLGIYVRI